MPAEYYKLKMYKVPNETKDRFDQWANLPEPDMIRKHEHRANMKMTEAKNIATYCWALLYYGPDVTQLYDARNHQKKEIPIIIRRYHDMMLREGWTDEQIMKEMFK